MMLLVRRFLADHARNGTNLLLLVLIPVVFVVVAADAMSDAARLLGGAGGGSGIATVTAGWAAGFLAAVAMYFQVSSARDTDRRLVLAGLARSRLVTARLVTGAALAVVGSAAALTALLLRTGIDQPVRVAAGTLMFAAVYLAFGAIVGATVPNPVNGTLLLLFVWIIDVFFGPTLSASQSLLTRVLPTHFVSLWTVDLPPGHGGPGELAVSVAWTAVALMLAFAVVLHTSRVARPSRALASRHLAWSQLATGLRLGWHEWRRTPVLWILLAVVPAVFIWLSDAVTPHGSTPVAVVEDGVRFTELVDPAHIHGGTMAPIAVGSLAALAGVFMGLDARAADQRLVLAGQRPRVVIGTRLGMVLTAAGVSSVAAALMTATVFEPHQWGPYLLALALSATTYGVIGMILGPVFGRVAGAYMAFLIPFLDLGIGQSPMLQGEPAAWAHYLPGYGSTRVLLDGALTSTFDETSSLLIAASWIVGLTAAFVVLFRPSVHAPATRRSHSAGPHPAPVNRQRA